VNGQAAPYIQYAYVRANSILKKVQNIVPAREELLYTLSAAEVELINVFSKFSQEVERAAKDMRPLLVANYAYDLAKTFNSFYNTCPVLIAEFPTAPGGSSETDDFAKFGLVRDRCP
jgi:arginyl-tRNA synthetase